ncbi:MAG: Ig-like domain-containing protein, partial [Lachnospiraceae bacterium]|nr:Ig-like domain-containing protein [Lachnospiraceae bacterium]
TEPTTAPTTAPTMAPENLTAIKLNSGLYGSQTGNKINITWGIADDADGYDVYVQYCGKEFTAKSLYSVNDGEITKLSVKKINGKAINKKKSYKAYVVAYKIIDGEKVRLGRSIYIHFAGSQSKKFTDVKSVNADNSSYTLNNGGTAQINADVVLNDTSKEELYENHTRQFRYATDNKAVATVSKTGQITAAGTGSCIIYVYAKNGRSKQINVTVE